MTPVNDDHIAVEVLDEVRSIFRALPEVVEEQAWAGTRWTVRRHNFAHVVHIAHGWPPAYARAASTEGPCDVLTFRSTGAELEALAACGHPYFRPVWGTRWHPSVAGLVLGADIDWLEVCELVTDSYCLVATRTTSPTGDSAGRRVRRRPPSWARRGIDVMVHGANIERACRWRVAPIGRAVPYAERRCDCVRRGRRLRVDWCRWVAVECRGRSVMGEGGGVRPPVCPGVERLQGGAQRCAECCQRVIVAGAFDQPASAELAETLIQHARGQAGAAAEDRARPEGTVTQLPQEPQRPAATEQVEGCHHRPSGARPSHRAARPRYSLCCHHELFLALRF